MTGLLPARRGAASILTRHLGMGPLQNLLLVFEEETGGVATLIDEVARSLEIKTMLVFVPRAVQSAARTQDSLPPSLVAAIQNADALVTCLNDSPECTTYRSRLLDCQNADLSIGHTPGISVSMLAQYFDVDIGEISKRCEVIALALAIGTKMTIITHDSKGERNELNLDIGGWDRLPVVSDGTIPRGAWGNLVPGETYIAPQESSATGSIVINGSLPGLVLGDSELLLNFDRGRLTNWWSGNKDVLMHFDRTVLNSAKQKNDPNWNYLAEIGIGVNDQILTLTGRPVIDEKAYRTAHIAIGENIGMGGTNRSSIHCDMTFLSPSILVGGKMLMDVGEVSWDLSRWQESLGDIEVNPDWLARANSITRSSATVDLDSPRLRKVCINAAQKKMIFELGDPVLSRLGIKLLRLLPSSDEEKVDWAGIPSRLGVSELVALKALRFLSIHGLAVIASVREVENGG